MIRFLSALLMLCGAAHAQVAIYHQSTVGSAGDILARQVAKQVTDVSGLPVITKNVPGADGLIALNAAAEDKNSVLVLAANYSAVLAKGEGANLSKFTPVQSLTTFDIILAVPTSSGVTTLEEFKKWSKTRKLNFASTGSSHNKMSEQFEKQIGFSAEYIVYKDRNQLVVDMMNGLTDFTFFGAFNQQFLAGVQAGKLRAIASVDAKRAESMPAVPSITEFGLKPINTFVWYGLAVHNDMPPAQKEKLVAALSKIMATDEMSEFMRKTNQRRYVATPTEMAQQLQDDVVYFR